MKTKILLPLLVLIITIGCKKEDTHPENTPFVGTWKWVGFGDSKTNTLKAYEATPFPCEDCYIITFYKNGSFKAKTTLDLSGNYTCKKNKIKFKNLSEYFMLKIGEMGDGNKFRSIFMEIYRYDIDDSNLKLFYSESEFLLFNLKNK